MRRWIALTAAVLSAPALVTATAATAQAAPADPAYALKRQFQADRGVKITEITRIDDTYYMLDAPTMTKTKIDGTVQFSPSGPVASDVTMLKSADPQRRKSLETPDWDGRPTVPIGTFTPHHVIGVGNHFYISDGIYTDRLPAGKTWVRSEKSNNTLSPTTRQQLNLLNPAVLRALVNSPTGRHSGDGLRHQGSITYGKLSKILGTSLAFPGPFRVFVDFDKWKISWRLWLDDKGLPKRLTTSELYHHPYASMTMTTDTRYSGWGTLLSITAPSSDQVIGEEYLPEDLPEFKVLVNAATTHPGGH
jgi:hypothetical protein